MVTADSHRGQMVTAISLLVWPSLQPCNYSTCTYYT